MWVNVQRGHWENHVALCSERVVSGLSPSNNSKAGVDIAILCALTCRFSQLTKVDGIKMLRSFLFCGKVCFGLVLS